MENFKVICLVGEGSFGRVFKAKRRDNKEIVALKIIRKSGRTQKELSSLHSECEIQKHLHHRNIIQMINSFETEHEIVVVTEFCKRDLHYILSKQTYLPEEAALPIVCDLVSALYYLHSNRVLHRDLKPQNVLMDKDGVAKLCDFGFARTMSRGTHVLTSIKGTPLYMAPELIEESPYDHNADLWSLGCIVYELVTGMPPFTTTSILQLVRMIRYEPVTWPAYLSPQCRDFLQGLLQKDPLRRLSWPMLIQHSFLQHRVSSSLASEASLPLTKELTSSQALAKECQKQDLAHKSEQNQGATRKLHHVLKQENAGSEREGVALVEKTPAQADPQTSSTQEGSSASGTSDEESARAMSPLETEEWLAFLQQSMKEVMRGDVESMSEKSFITMVTNALTHQGSVPKVSEYIACLLSLPFVAPGVTQSELATINLVYREVKVVPSLLYGLKLVTSRAPGCSGSDDSAIESSKINTDRLVAIEKLMVLVNQLVHSGTTFLSQLCDSVALLHLPTRLHLLLTLHRVRPRITTDIIAILAHILRMMPENANIVDNCIQPGLDWYRMMKYGNKTLQRRICVLIQLLAQHCPNTLQAMWNNKLQKYIQVLAYDSLQDLRCAAEDTIEVVLDLQFFDKKVGDESS